jgi:hypothetical protein
VAVLVARTVIIIVIIFVDILVVLVSAASVRFVELLVKGALHGAALVHDGLLVLGDLLVVFVVGVVHVAALVVVDVAGRREVSVILAHYQLFEGVCPNIISKDRIKLIWD